MDYEQIENKTKKIILNIQFISNNISLLKNKIVNISATNSKLGKNKMLKQENNSNLEFQCNILKNEFYYYTNIYNILIDKHSKELFEISEYILIILFSLNQLEIDNNQEKNTIYSKIIYTNKISNNTSGKLKELINNIINNLKVVDEFIQLFNDYIDKLHIQNNKKNLHSNNFEINVKYKKETIVLEYNKYNDRFNKTIDYFLKCSTTIVEQINNSNLLNFFLKIKLKDNTKTIYNEGNKEQRE
tara:strand:- start:3280 stop:4011 length:732 start_codon:yes stop_codon:yes gene_type:complete